MTLTPEQIEAVGWKWGYPAGFRTEDGVITAWPASANGGVMPTQAQVDQWLAEYQASQAQQPLPDLRQKAAAYVQALDDYLAIADTATAPQVREQVKRLSQMMRRVIVRLVQID